MSKLFVLCVFHKYCSSNNGSVSHFLDTFKRHFCGFPTVISLRGRQHFWICSFLVSIDWRSQHNLWILGWRDKLSSKKVESLFQATLRSLNIGSARKKKGISACLTASFILFFWVLFFCLVLFLLFFIGQKCAALLFRTKIVSIVYFDHERKNLRSELS